MERSKNFLVAGDTDNIAGVRDTRLSAASLTAPGVSAGKNSALHMALGTIAFCLKRRPSRIVAAPA